jgi:hypothetical protein
MEIPGIGHHLPPDGFRYVVEYIPSIEEITPTHDIEGKVEIIATREDHVHHRT